MNNIAQALHTTIEAVCPIVGVSIGAADDKTTWRVNFKPTATPDQQAAALAVLATFDATGLDTRTTLAKALDTALTAIPSIDPRVKAVFVEWRKQVS